MLLWHNCMAGRVGKVGLSTVNPGCFLLAPPQAPAWSHPLRLPLSSRLNSGNLAGGGREADGRGLRAGPDKFFQSRRLRLAEPRFRASLTSQNNSDIRTFYLSMSYANSHELGFDEFASAGRNAMMHSPAQRYHQSKIISNCTYRAISITRTTL